MSGATSVLPEERKPSSNSGRSLTAEQRFSSKYEPKFRKAFKDYFGEGFFKPDGESEHLLNLLLQAGYGAQRFAAAHEKGGSFSPLEIRNKKFERAQHLRERVLPIMLQAWREHSDILTFALAAADSLEFQVRRLLEYALSEALSESQRSALFAAMQRELGITFASPTPKTVPQTIKVLLPALLAQFPPITSLAFDVGRLCETIHVLPALQKQNITNAINAVLEDDAAILIGIENVARMRDFLVQAFAKKYPDKTDSDKVDIFVRTIAAHMGEACPNLNIQSSLSPEKNDTLGAFLGVLAKHMGHEYPLKGYVHFLPATAYYPQGIERLIEVPQQ